ncbi:hypothetical protein SEA_VANLEE_61 [Gordonia phage VanLee]|uniref:Uncharacterized protein n=1 Tax=Gordonia phage VanLee TaxID=2845816 RepID=A0A8F2IFD5_9CAUD|nr:hypothetical protein QEH49_gp061 [Gordonia phage VanLee]QWS68178.1 hypothetical protein SEA_VANLEE_61 [Gordonia phage VanLee]
MSAIYFHTPDAEVTVSGRERAMAGLLCTNLAIAVATVVVDERTLARALPTFGPSVAQNPAFLSAALGVCGEDELLDAAGGRHSAFETVLNTVLAVGNDPMRLLARINGQCEIHGFVEPANHAWFADTVTAGLDAGIMRPGLGWDGVIDLARATEHPIVMSYSVCNSFPNQSATTWTPDGDGPRNDDPDYEPWYELSDEAKWEHGMAYLRAHPGLLEIGPGPYAFGAGVTLLDIARAHQEAHA